MSISRQRRSSINDFTDKLRELADLSTPINKEKLQDFVDRIKGKLVMHGPFSDEQLEGCDGLIEKKGESFEIVVNDNFPPRTCFTIAHEIGHLFLHMGYMIDKDKWEKQDLFKDSIRFRNEKVYNIEESEANEFSASFLMPRKEFRAIVRQNEIDGEVNLQKIADHFNVSLQAVKNRGIFLGLFNR